jgi:hypothetical protein
MFGNDSNRRAIVIPVARVDNVSVATGSLVVSAPVPTAFLGLTHKLELDIKAAGIVPSAAFKFHSVALMVHAFEIAPGHRRIPPHQADEHNKQAGSMIDDPEGSLLCTIVISAEIVDHGAMEAIRSWIERNILRYRLGGGRFVRTGFVSSKTGKDGIPGRRPIEAAWDSSEFANVIRNLPPGSLLADRTYLMEDKEGDGRDAMDRILDAMARVKTYPGQQEPHIDAVETDVAKNAKRGRPIWKRNQLGWFVALPIGWRALSSVAQRSGMRDGNGVVGHAWVEDVVGLGEWVYTRNAFKAGQCQADVFWSYKPCPAGGPYLVEGNPT